MLEDTLSKEEHIKELNKKLVNYAGIFAKVENNFPSRHMNYLIQCFIYSQRDYGIELYAGEQGIVSASM